MSVRSPLSRLLAVTLLSTGAVVALPPAAYAAGPPVTGLTISAGYDEATLSWDAFSALGYDKVVCYAQGSTPPAYAGCTEGFRGLEDTATVTGLEPGTVYSFAVYTVDGESASEPATTTLRAARVTPLRVDRTKVTWGDEVTFSGKVTDAESGAGYTLPLVIIGGVNRAGELFVFDQVQGDFDGAFSYTASVGESLEYVAVFAGEGETLGAVSPTASRVNVASLVLLDPVKKKVKLGKRVQLVVAAGPVARREPIVVRQLVKKKWKKVASALPDRDGVALVKLKVKKKGTYKYRAERSGVAGTDAGTSKKVSVKVVR